ncbi:MAG: endonuclease/exonuclease/phosphatase family protein [Bacteroidales bacterium]
MLRLLLLTVFVVVLLQLPAQDQGFYVMFYNTENLFDTEDDPLKADEGFTPEGVYHWNKSRLYRKLNNLARVIVAAGEWEMPGLVGLCEVENDRVLHMLLNYTPLKSTGYQFIHHESADPRGIDVVLLYLPKLFKVIQHRAVPIRDSLGIPLNTRDILFVSGILPTGDTLHVFINHWPSKYGGVAGSMPRRFAAARTLRHLTDSLQKSNTLNILIMGDLNDNPFDLSVKEVLGACPDTTSHCPSGLIDQMAPLMKRQNLGTHKYQGQWDIIDHIIVSHAMATCRSQVCLKQAEIFVPDFLLVADEAYTGRKVYRTYNGMRYEGGFADHLPVRARISFK